MTDWLLTASERPMAGPFFQNFRKVRKEKMPMQKIPFVTKEKLDEIISRYPTPFYIYDEKGIRENARALNEAFAWNKGFQEFFAVKANPNPFLINILREYGFGCDCSSLTELMLSHAIGVKGKDIMFSSTATPAEEFQYARKIGATINLDDFTHIEYLEKVTGGLPDTISCRYNPGGVFRITTDIMDSPQDAKFGFTKGQLLEGFKILKEKGVKRFGIHAFLASNTVTNEYYPMLARELFGLAVQLKKETGVSVSFINFSGGIGIPYMPEQEANDIRLIGEGVHKAFEEILIPEGMGDVAIYTELGRFMMMPKIEVGDILAIHDAGAHGYSMGYNYNGKLKSAEILLKEEGSFELIRRAETPEDYFATFDCFDILRKVRML